MALSVFLASLFTVTYNGAAFSEPSVPERVIIANSGSHALLIWDATSIAAPLAMRNSLDTGAIRDLELRALRLIAASLDEVPRAQTISIRIVYRQVNASGAYGTQTFEGAVPIAQLSMPIAIARAHKNEWTTTQPAPALPAGVSVQTYDSSNGS